MLFKEDWKSIIEAMLRFPGISSQSDLEKKGNIPTGTVSHYKRGEVAPSKENFLRLAKAVGMDENRFKGFCASVWAKTYPVPGAALGGADEVRDPRTPYRGASLADRTRVVMAIDLSGLPSEIAFALRQMREEIRRLIEDHAQAASRFELLLDAFEDLYRGVALGSTDSR